MWSLAPRRGETLSWGWAISRKHDLQIIDSKSIDILIIDYIVSKDAVLLQDGISSKEKFALLSFQINLEF